MYVNISLYYEIGTVSKIQTQVQVVSFTKKRQTKLRKATLFCKY